MVGRGGWPNTSPPERLQERNRTSVSFAGLEGKLLSEFSLVASTALSVWFYVQQSFVDDDEIC